MDIYDGRDCAILNQVMTEKVPAGDNLVGELQVQMIFNALKETLCCLKCYDGETRDAFNYVIDETINLFAVLGWDREGIHSDRYGVFEKLRNRCVLTEDACKLFMCAFQEVRDSVGTEPPNAQINYPDEKKIEFFDSLMRKQRVMQQCIYFKDAVKKLEDVAIRKITKDYPIARKAGDCSSSRYFLVRSVDSLDCNNRFLFPEACPYFFTSILDLRNPNWYRKNCRRILLVYTITDSPDFRFAMPFKELLRTGYCEVMLRSSAKPIAVIIDGDIGLGLMEGYVDFQTFMRCQFTGLGILPRLNRLTTNRCHLPQSAFL